MKKKRYTTINLVMCAVFTALIAVGAYIRIPLPAVPMTLQVFFVVLASLLLGGRIGGASALSYMMIGLAGIPIFTEGGGFGYVFKPSFGYIIGFVIGAYVIGKIARKKKSPGYKRLLAASFAGLFVIYFVGMTYVYLIKNMYLGEQMGLWPLFLYCFLLTIPGDILSCFICALIAKRMIPVVSCYQ